MLGAHNASLIEFSGGSDGVRDEGLLESALARPNNVHAYEPDAPMTELAAAYGFGIASNHPFVDGNKRVAFVAMRARFWTSTEFASRRRKTTST